jgi:hypothetical protein
MTLIGKILTFLNFFLSLVFLGFAISVNTLNKELKSGQSWYQVAKQLKENAERSSRDAALREESITKLQTQVADGLKREAEADTLYKKTMKDSEEKNRQDATARADLVNKFQVAEGRVQDYQKEADISQKQVKEQVQRLAQANEQIAKLNFENQQRTNELVQQKFQTKTLSERLDKSVTENNRLMTELERLRQQADGGGGVAAATPASKALLDRPPPEDLRGHVKEIGTNGLVSISLGSDHGLLRGHTLQVYRLNPTQQYLGKIVIIELNPHEAVGQLLTPQNSKLIQKNDIVASRIMVTP